MRKCIEHNSQLMNRLYFSLIRCQVWENLGEKKKENKKYLIEKYELIKNIPPRFLGEIDVKDFYSEMEYKF